jgi:hypothetical protein
MIMVRRYYTAIANRRKVQLAASNKHYHLADLSPDHKEKRRIRIPLLTFSIVCFLDFRRHFGV